MFGDAAFKYAADIVGDERTKVISEIDRNVYETVESCYGQKAISGS